MKKVRQIMAIVGIVLLVALYVSTLILAITDHTGTMRMFMASVVATIVVPVLIWIYSFIYKLLKGKDEDENEDGRKNG
ncbi:MAG: hypothetical protein LUI02_06855 [Clostridiales bacterium]|nr:hypothetical protein [Clostridiales bacterium]